MMKRFFLILSTLSLLSVLACYLDVNVQCLEDSDCLTGFKCANNLCECPAISPGKAATKCEVIANGVPSGTFVCANTQTSNKHCGTCGKDCGSGLCNQGKCEPCDTGKGRKVCSGTCVDPQKDSKHCGTCGNTCAKGEVCTQGVCGCPTGWKNCGAQLGCVDVKNDPKHCGKCTSSDQSHVCGAGKTCVEGACSNCGAVTGQKLCENGKKCVQTLEDPKNCGACGNACKTGELCCAGTCTPNDAKNCGACGNSCGANSKCENGTCSCTAKDEISCSPDGCVNAQTSNKHCGTCGNACKTGESCKKGACCPTGQQVCSGNGQCIDVQTDNNNCGSCGTVCKDGKTCKDGSCQKCSPQNKCSDNLVCKSGKCVCEKGCGWVVGNIAKETTATSQTVGHGIAVDNNGNAYVTGFIQGKAQLDPSRPAHTGDPDVFVIKYTSAGKVAWSRFITNKGPDQGLGIAVTSNGDKVYVVGTFTGTMNFSKASSGKTATVTSAGDTDIFLLELNGNTGATFQVQRAGGPGSDEGRGIILDSQENVFITGTVHYKKGVVPTFPQTTANPLANAQFTAGSRTGFFAEYSSRNNQFQRAVLLDAPNTEFNAITINNSGSIFITGTSESAIGLHDGSNVPCSGYSMLAFEKGKVKPINAACALGSARGNGVTWNGTRAVSVGYFESSAKFGSFVVNGHNPDLPPPASNRDVIVTSLGSKTFASLLRGEAANTDNDATDKDDGGTARATTHVNGKTYVAGDILGTLDFNGHPAKATPLAGKRNSDIFIARIDGTTGKWDWSIAAGGEGEDRALSVAVTASGAIYVTGYISKTVSNFKGTNGSVTLQTKAAKEFFVWKLP